MNQISCLHRLLCLDQTMDSTPRQCYDATRGPDLALEVKASERLNEVHSLNTGRWTNQEHMIFLRGLNDVGKNWRGISNMLKTRTVTQVRTHAQKFFLKVTRRENPLNGNKKDLALEYTSVRKDSKLSSSCLVEANTSKIDLRKSEVRSSKGYIRNAASKLQTERVKARDGQPASKAGDTGSNMKTALLVDKVDEDVYADSIEPHGFHYLLGFGDTDSLSLEDNSFGSEGVLFETDPSGYRQGQILDSLCVDGLLETYLLEEASASEVSGAVDKLFEVKKEQEPASARTPFGRGVGASEQDLGGSKCTRPWNQLDTDEQQRLVELLPVHQQGADLARFTSLCRLAQTPEFVNRSLQGNVSYLCPFPGCCLQVDLPCRLYAHMEEHRKGRCRYFLCDVCSSVFYSTGSVNLHRATHVKMKQKHICIHAGCEKKYVTVEGLRLHNRNYHEIKKPWRCFHAKCGRSFVRKSDLKLHILRMHIEERPFLCTENGCPRGFVCHSELRRHLSKFHQVRLPKPSKVSIQHPKIAPLDRLVHKAEEYYNSK